jgi:hypothetical protein
VRGIWAHWDKTKSFAIAGGQPQRRASTPRDIANRTAHPASRRRCLAMQCTLPASLSRACLEPILWRQKTRMGSPALINGRPSKQSGGGLAGPPWAIGSRLVCQWGIIWGEDWVRGPIMSIQAKWAARSPVNRESDELQQHLLAVSLIKPFRPSPSRGVGSRKHMSLLTMCLIERSPASESIAKKPIHARTTHLSFGSSARCPCLVGR